MLKNQKDSGRKVFTVEPFLGPIHGFLALAAFLAGFFVLRFCAAAFLAAIDASGLDRVERDGG